MRISFILLCFMAIFSSCKKDKFTTEPQIEFKSVSPNYTSTDIGAVMPEITLGITDSEGDVGLKEGRDTAFIYIKNTLTGKSDSLPFPDLGSSGKSNFKADILVSIAKALECKSLPGNQLHIDTLRFEVYVRDFDRNKSNVITSDPVYFNCR